MASRRGRRRQPLFFSEVEGGGPVPGAHASSHENGGADQMALGLMAGTINLTSQVANILPLANGGLGFDATTLAAAGQLLWSPDGSAVAWLDAPGAGTRWLQSSGGVLSWSTTVGDAATLDGQAPSYYLDLTNHTGEITLAQLVDGPDDAFLTSRSGTQQWVSLQTTDIPDLSATYLSTGGGTISGSLLVTGNLTAHGSITLGDGPYRLFFNENGSDRNYFAPRNSGDTDWDWGAEFGYNLTDDRWYFDEDLIVGGTMVLTGALTNAGGVSVSRASSTAGGYSLSPLRPPTGSARTSS
jgi:hypothetical protein